MLVCVVPLMKVEGYIGEFSGSLVGLEPGGVVTGWNSILKLNPMFMCPWTLTTPGELEYTIT